MTVAITSDPDAVSITFNPRVNDWVTFNSDRQTEKGPSGGFVSCVDHRHGLCWIMHSDTKPPGEQFEMSKVRVLGRTRREPAKYTRWLLQ
jgi:hypothetical protein